MRCGHVELAPDDCRIVLVLDAYDFMCDSCGDVQSLALMAMLRATFKFYRQATDQIVGTSYKGASFLNGFF